MFSYECDFLEAKESGKLPVLLVPGGLLVGFDDLQRRATCLKKGHFYWRGLISRLIQSTRIATDDELERVYPKVVSSPFFTTQNTAIRKKSAVSAQPPTLKT